MKYFALVLLLICRLCLSLPLPYSTEEEHLGEQEGEDVQGRSFGFLKGLALGYIKGKYQGSSGGGVYQGGLQAIAHPVVYEDNPYHVGQVGGNTGGYNGFSNGYTGQGVFVPGVGGIQSEVQYDGVLGNRGLYNGGSYNGGLYNGGLYSGGSYSGGSYSGGSYNGGLYNGGLHNGIRVNGVQPNGVYLNGGVVGGNVW